MFPKIVTDVENIPAEMKALRHWINWRWEFVRDKNGEYKLTKVPYIPASLSGDRPAGASSSNPETWDTFETAVKNISDRTGIGFEIGSKKAGNHSGLACIDLDEDVFNEDGTLTQKAKEILEPFADTYIERSQRHGLHVWFKADLAEERPKKKNGIELYSNVRYITMTGNPISANPIRDKQDEALRLLRERMDYSPAPSFSIVGTSPANEAPAVTLPYQEVFDKCATSKDGITFLSLFYFSEGRRTRDALIDYQGFTDEDEAGRAMEDALDHFTKSEYGGFDFSKMDYALCRIVDKYNGHDLDQVDSFLRSSNLIRPKWDEKRGAKTYGEITLDAVARNRDNDNYIYTPPEYDRPEIVEEAPQKSEAPAREPVEKYSALAMKDSYLDALEFAPPRIRTGFPYLDQLLDGGLYASLITIGAETGLGKTTFVLQMMNSIARRGDDALIISLEMSKHELISRSISALTYKLDKENAVTVPEIMKSMQEESRLRPRQREILEKAKEQFFKEQAPNLYIREAMGDMSTDKIRDILEDHVQQKLASPVVMVDYLQLLQPPATIHHSMTDKQVIDRNIMSLKQISRDYNTPVIVISALNRMTYTTQQTNNDGPKSKRVKLESFKESGAIEYSSDIVIGLNKTDFDEATKTAQMELEILKNRNGGKGIQCFDYFYCFNTFSDTNLRRPTGKAI